jgi:metallo-beta-lactamase class B
MNRTSVVVFVLAGVVLSASALAQAPSSPVDEHIAAARVAAGLDYRATFVNLCLPNPPRGGGAGAAGRGAPPAAVTATPPTPDRATWYAPPFKIFDNFYWLGTRQHSSWALQTSAGIIMIDTNFAWATGPEIIEGMNTLGLNPRDIKYLVISHAHGDHDQGAALLQKRYGAKVVMGAADWDSTLQRPDTAAGGVPKRDVVVGAEGQKITLGDTTVTVIATPGHTPGTLSYIFTVKDRGRTLAVAYSGGTAFNFPRRADTFATYRDSQMKMADAARAAGATVLMSNHTEFDRAYDRVRLAQLPRTAAERHPYETDVATVQRYFEMTGTCAEAQRLSLQ